VKKEDEVRHQTRLRAIPAVHKVTAHPTITQYASKHDVPRELVVAAVQQVIAKLREQRAAEKESAAQEPLLDKVAAQTVDTLQRWLSPRLRRVINGTGVVLHTNLGRALLSEEAVAQVKEAAAHYSNLEYDIDAGERGSRHSHIEELICRLTGAEAAMVVNNNAAAVYLVLRALAANREVVVSRGHLVEIGGSFRVSEIMKESGAKLVEVGTTNKTHRYDYEDAIHEQTVMLMKVHTSNFRTVGFTSSVSLQELADLGKQHGVIVYEDLGSGVLYDLRAHGIGDEPTVGEALRSGADLVSFSGDKLLGGPQAGIIAGKKQWISQLKRHQAARMLRVDKMTLAALDATLRQYLQPEKAKQAIPVLRDLVVSADDIRVKARHFTEEMKDCTGVACRIVEDESEVGGGTMPGVTLPTAAVDIEISGMPAHRLEQRLRAGSIPVVVRLVKDRVRIDFRTVAADEVRMVAEAVKRAAQA
jgi:L-seryl-tRNA(Ser) seleniumtransferase